MTDASFGLRKFLCYDVEEFMNNNFGALEELGNKIVKEVDEEDFDIVEQAKKSFFSALKYSCQSKPILERQASKFFSLGYAIDNSCAWIRPIVNMTRESSNIAKAIHVFFISIASQPVEKGDSEGVRIARRYKQIITFPDVVQTLHLPPLRIAQIAIQIAEIHRNTAIVDRYIKKSPGSPKTLIINGTKKDIYILCKYKGGRHQRDSSGERTISTVIRVPQDITKSSSSLCQATIKDDIEISPQEERIRKILNGKPGIWPMEFIFTYTKKRYDLQKPTVFMPWASFDLELMQPQPDWPSQIIIAQHLILGLYSMHKNKIVHGDIKKRNILVTEDKEGVVAGFIDFGHSFFYPLREAYLVGILKMGYYGSISYTPPEKWGREADESTKEDYFAMDVWALGCILWEVWFARSVPWSKAIDQHYFMECQKGVELLVSQSMIESIGTQIKETVEEPLKLLEGEEKEVKDLYVRMIYNMIRLDPKKRYTAEQLLGSMQEIFPRVKELQESSV